MATIYCFTSTGNSLYAARKIAEKIDANVVSMTQAVDICDDDIIGFVFPTYFFGLPKIVERFISNLNITNKGAYIFAVTTYGTITYGVLGAVDKILSKKQLKVSYGNTLKSVENYIVGYVVNDTEELHKQIDGNLDVIAKEIAEKRHNRLAKYSILNKIIYSTGPAKHGDCDRFFTVSGNCTGCGICQNVCPVNNIIIEDGNPVFGHNCEHCIACIHACPVAAMEWKKSTKKSTVNRKRYRNPHVSLNELIKFNSSNTGDKQQIR